MRIFDIFKKMMGGGEDTPERDENTALPPRMNIPASKGSRLSNYKDGQTLDEIRAGFAEEAQRVIEENHNMTPISHITAVGALQNPHGAVELNDTHYILNSITTMLEAGIPVSPDVDIDVVNFKDGRDFLAETNPTDAVLLCRIWAGDTPGDDYWHNLDGLPIQSDTPEDFGHVLDNHVMKGKRDTDPDSIEDKGFSDPRDQYVTFMQSPKSLNNMDLWGERISQSGAKIVFASVDGGHIGTGFEHDDLITLNAHWYQNFDPDPRKLPEPWDGADEWSSRFGIYGPDIIMRKDFYDDVQNNDGLEDDSLLGSMIDYHEPPEP